MSSLTKNWQKDCKERCKFLFNSDTLSDFKFVVRASRKYGERDSKRTHKFLLSISSPVFFAMFCGEMAETKEHIDLPDCEYEGMLELLRYIYTDEVCLNGNNVMQVLYLAEKYMIPCLTDKCAEYLGKNLDFSNVLCVLKHAQQFENKNLLFHCWDLIDKRTDKALKSNEFLSIERSFLGQLVERNTLSIREVELFKAVDCWAKEECKRQQLKANGSTKRQVLGEQIVKNIRFPIMKQIEFKDVVLPSKILTRKETRMLMTHFSSPLSPADGFLDVHRVGSLLRCCRFKSFAPHGSIIENDPDEDDWFTLKVNKDIILYGISLLGKDGGSYSVTLKIVTYDDDDDDDDFDNNAEEIIHLSQTGTFTSGRKECSNGYYYGFDVIFDKPFAVKKDVVYFIESSVDGPGYYLGNEGINAVKFSGVKFNFEHECVANDTIHGLVNRSLCAELLFRIRK
ncbi:BTB/POZ domain-containing protein 6-like isoform X2 [Oculina patagonica]